MKRALTMVEMLAAVALLSLIAAAMGSWTRIVADVQATVPRRVELERTLDAALRVVRDDLVSGDLGQDVTTGRPPRVRVEDDGRLVIATRDGGPVVRTYRFDPVRRRLEVVETRGGGAVARVLVDGLEGWTCRFNTTTRRLEIDWATPSASGTWRAGTP